MNKKTIPTLLFILVLLILFASILMGSNAGGFFRTETPTFMNTPTSTPDFTPSMTPTSTETLTSIPTQTPTYTPTSTNTPVPSPPTKKPKDNNDDGGESCPPGFEGTPPDCTIVQPP